MVCCDMCGRQGGLVTAEVEGVEMNVCQNCARYGTVRRKPDAVRVSPQKMHKEQPFRVTHHYAGVLRQAREKQGLSQEDFARFLQERESIIAKWEQGRMQPSVEVARRLEKTLGVMLVEEELEQAFVQEKIPKGDGFTLGDFMKVRKKL